MSWNIWLVTIRVLECSQLPGAISNTINLTVTHCKHCINAHSATGKSCFHSLELLDPAQCNVLCVLYPACLTCCLEMKQLPQQQAYIYSEGAERGAVEADSTHNTASVSQWLMMCVTRKQTLRYDTDFSDFDSADIIDYNLEKSVCSRETMSQVSCQKNDGRGHGMTMTKTLRWDVPEKQAKSAYLVSEGYANPSKTVWM